MLYMPAIVKYNIVYDNEVTSKLVETGTCR